MIRALSAGLLLLPLLAGLACGDAPSQLPAPLACPVSTPTQVPVARPNGQNGAAYRLTTSRGVDRLGELLIQFRNRWPDGKFSRQAEFRTDFARYVDDSICLVQSLTALEPPNPTFEGFTTEFGTVTQTFLKVQADGRAAVGARNVSGYRDWTKAIDTQMSAFGLSLAKMPPPGARGPQ